MATQSRHLTPATMTVSQASWRYSFEDPEDFDAADDEDTSELRDDQGQRCSVGEVADPDWDPDDGGDFIHLAKLGSVDPVAVLEALDEITDRYLTDVEGDLLHLMRLGRRPVEISRILRIPECEVVRLRRNCFRKVLVIFTFDYHRDKRAFLCHARELLQLNDKQSRILTMFFDYYGLRPIAEAIGTRPSNVHRSLGAMHKRLDAALAPDSPYRPFLEGFTAFKYLNCVQRGANKP